MDTRALTVVIHKRSVQDDRERAQSDAMLVATQEGFDEEPASVEEMDAASEPAWAFRWERTE
jgi:hypothetical protein